MTKYLVTEGDYNDVFNRTEMDFKDWNEAEQYAKNQFKPEYLNQVEDISSMDSVCYAIYYPVVDDNGNEIDINDPRYDELSETQESRIEYYIEIQELD